MTASSTNTAPLDLLCSKKADKKVMVNLDTLGNPIVHCSPLAVIEAWRQEYNEERTHSMIGDVTPQEFIHNYHKGAQLTQDFTSSALV